MNPSPLSSDAATAVARERLRLLTIGYYISGAIGAVIVSFLLVHFTMLLILSFIPDGAWENGTSHNTAQGPANSATAVEPIVFRILAAIIGCFILAGWALGGLTIYAGRCIHKRQHRVFVYVMAAINCLWIPYGTLLGIATFLTFGDARTKAEFEAKNPSLPSVP